MEEIEAEAKRGYHSGGFKVWDVLQSHAAEGNRAPEDRRHRRAPFRHGRALRLHLDRDGRLRRQHPRHLRHPRPAKPEEVSRWWMPGQHTGGGETPTWLGASIGCTMRFVSVTRCGRAAGTPALISSTCRTCRSRRRRAATTIIRCSRSRRIRRCRCRNRSTASSIALAVDEEDQAQSANEEQMRRGRAHACILTFDVTDPADIKPLGQFQVSELNSPFFAHAPAPVSARTEFCERMSGTILLCRPGSAAACASSTSAIRCRPREIGHFIPEPAGGRRGAADQ